MKTPAAYTDAMTPVALNNATGFSPTFITGAIPVTDDLLSPAQKSMLPLVNQKQRGKLDYTNLSVYYHTGRKVPFYSAYNINLACKGKSKRAAKFKPDPRFSEEEQLSYKKFYNLVKGSDKDFDIGHMAGCDEMAWDDDAQLKSLQTFFFPNTCPQAAALNQKLWNQLERKLVTAQNKQEEGKICVFTGPVIDANDPPYIHVPEFQIPMRFFKVVVFEFNQKLYATGLIMSHINIVKKLNLVDVRNRLVPARTEAVKTPIDDFPHNGIFQVNLSLIKQLTGIAFKWPGVTPLKIPVKYNAIQEIDAHETPGDLEHMPVNALRQPGLAHRSRNPYGFILAR